MLSFALTFYLTKSILLMIKCQIDMTELCWSANITSFSDLIRCSFQKYFIKERWRSQCPSTMLFNIKHAHEFFKIVLLWCLQFSPMRYNRDTTFKNRDVSLLLFIFINFILVSKWEWKYTTFTLVHSRFVALYNIFTSLVDFSLLSKIYSDG